MSDGALYLCKGPAPGGAVCGVQKGATNHWFICWITKGEFRCRAFSAELIEQMKAKGVDVKWLCGQQCAQSTFERFLATGAL